MLWILVCLCVLVIASCHWLAVLISKKPPLQQQCWASFGGGAGLAYVFIHLLPELASGGRTISDAVGMQRYLPTEMTESLLFGVTLLGVLIPYASGVLLAQKQRSIGWIGPIRLSTFALVSYLYAYSLPSLLTTGISYGLLFTLAISVHVLLADRTLASDHPLAFRRRFRWIGTAALFLGAIQAAVLHPISDLHLAVATAFVGGGLLISVFREELPDAKHSSLSWFSMGLLTMMVLLLIATALHDHG